MVAAPDATLIEVPQPPTSPRRNVPMDRVELSGRNGMVFSAGRDVTSQVEGQMELAGSLETTRSDLDAVVDSIITTTNSSGCSTSSRYRPNLRRFARRATRYELAQHCLAR